VRVAHVFAAFIAACKGNKQVAQELEQAFQAVERKNPERKIVAVLRRILKGERGAALAEGLDKVDAAVVGQIVNGLENG
jgi:hypothetical protein